MTCNKILFTLLFLSDKCSQAPKHLLLRKINKEWVKTLAEIKMNQSNINVEIPVLLMCQDPTKTKEQIDKFLSETIHTLRTPSEVQAAIAEGWKFWSLGGNHSCQVARDLRHLGKQWEQIQCVVICSVEEKYVALMRGVGYCCSITNIEVE